MGIIATKADGITEKLRQTNRYDGEGLRYETEENGKVIRFLFDRGELAQESREGEKISYARGRQPVSLSRSGKERNYFVQDEMGSTLFLLDHNHEIQKTYRYDAFGNILKETGELSNRLTYTGQMYDGAAGQYYLRARFYNPAIGRFLQEDTYRGDGLNLYAYCANNPVMYYDPSGYIGLCPKGKTDQYKVDDPLGNPKLKEIYDKWLQNGIDKQEALKYLQQFGGRPDVEYLPYIDKLAEQAYQNVLNDPQNLLPKKMYDIMQKVPFLKDAFIGTAVDWEFKKLIEQSVYIPDGMYSITRQGQWGADLIYMGNSNGNKGYFWVDITTKKQADYHFNKYYNNGYVTPYR